MSDNSSNRGADEAVWFSALTAAAAFFAQRAHPSVAISAVFLIAVLWTFWSIYKMLLNRM